MVVAPGSCPILNSLLIKLRSHNRKICEVSLNLNWGVWTIDVSIHDILIFGVQMDGGSKCEFTECWYNGGLWLKTIIIHNNDIHNGRSLLGEITGYLNAVLTPYY